MPTNDSLSQFIEENRISNAGQLLFDCIPGLLFFVKDANRHFIYINQELAEFMGLDNKEQIIGRPDTDFFATDIEQSYAADDKRVIEEGYVVKNKVELITTSQRLIQWHITNKVPLYSKDGHVCGLSGVTRKFEGNTNALHHSALSRAIDHIASNYPNEIKLIDMAKACGLSLSAFERHFKKSFHLTPIQYLNRYRIQQACSALSQSDEPISAIAMDCGFYDQSHFTRSFLRVLHTTPAAYRKRYT
ncbi:MAG: AraC family transcriptional regulator [Opitutaceae bacterium]|nr:AraC family transcriptional regulator [Opitutaceae bacterium]